MAKNDFTEKAEELSWDFDGKKLTKSLDFDSFSESIDFLNSMMDAIEDIGVHPKVHVSEDGLKLTLPASGQIKKDHLDLAEQIDDL